MCTLTVTVMGCVQAKTLEGPEPKGLDRLKLENGYVASNADFVAHLL